MPEPLTYHVVDVFTDRPYAGNPLAVVLGAEGLATAQLQALAREFNLSETAFPLQVGAVEGATYELRTFTPSVELPFAGHPSVGAAWLLADLGLLEPGTVVQRCGAGDLPLVVSPAGGDVTLTGGTPLVGEPLDAARLLAAVGLDAGDLAGAPRQAGTGLPWTHLPVRREALARARPAAAALQDVVDLAPAGVYVHAWAAEERTAYARGFPGALGILEDPATGSAALGLGVYLVASDLLPGDGESAYTVVQGVEMGRPSTLRGAVTASGGVAVSARVAGSVSPVASGTIRVPAG